jgi:outer membrane protein OmpA-like peptidoglycan-associated protein
MYIKNNTWIAFLYTFALIFFLPLFLISCASSDVSRGSSKNFNKVYNDTASIFEPSDSSVVESYQDANQSTKGAIAGGLAGALVGSSFLGVPIVPAAAGGAIFGGALGAYLDSHTSLLDKLENRGIPVLVLGDQVMLVASSARIFNGRTARINTSYYSNLDLIAKFINVFPNITVKVSAFTNQTPEYAINRVLTQQQADSIVHYLWARGLNTRMVYAAGYGGTKIISKNNSGFWNAGANYRIEITLEKLPI